MNQPLLSIAVPTYNRAAKLETQLSSLHEQLSKSLFSSYIEVVVVDNCSDDSTQDLINNFSTLERKYIFSSYKNATNIGPDLNFGQAILRSQGIFSWLLSDDDILLEGSIDVAYKSLSANKGVGFCFVNYYLDHSNESTAINMSGENILAKNIREYISATMFAEAMCSSCIFRKSLLSEDLLTKVRKGGGYIHMKWVLDILKNHHALVITSPLFNFCHPGVFETRKAKGIRKDEVPFYLEAHLDFLKVTAQALTFSLGLFLRLKIYRLALNENFNQILYYKITDKGLGINYPALRLVLPIMIRRFYFHPTFWIFQIPLLLLPSNFARFAEPLRWKYLEFRGFLGNITRKIFQSI
ncbi:glycosyltransferase [Gammaproteobacteria bacterium]|nr:glycosyltransferase [Gammaproteobacteria bacterium]